MIIGHALGGIVCALQRQLLHGLIWIVATVIGLLVTVIFLLSGYGLMALALGILIQACLVLVMEGAVFWHLQKQILSGAPPVVAWDAVVELMKPSAMMFMASGGATLTRQSDNLLIGMFMGSRAVLVYDLTKRAFELLRMLMGYPVAAFAPALAHFFGELREKMAKARGLTETLIYVSSLTGLVLMGGYITLDRAFVGLWVGPTLYAGDLVVILIGIYGLLSAQALPLYNIVFNRGRIYTAALANLTEALLRLALLAVLTWWLGLPGAALAGLLSLAATGWWILWHRYCLDFNIPWMETLNHMLPLALVGVGLLGIGIFLRQLTAPTTILAFLVHSGCYLGAACLWVVLVDRRVRGLVADVCRGRPLIFSGPT